jgi:molybdate transport system permease protein
VWRSDRALAILAGLATAGLVAFVVLPVISIFFRVPVHELLSQWLSPATLRALGVSMKTSLIALGLILAVGTPAAYVLATRRFRGRGALVTLLELPLVLPPAVAGIGLFAAFGRTGLLGGALAVVGVKIPFTQVAVVMALSFVAMPFYVRLALAAFAAVDPEMLAASRTLGSGPARTLFRVAIPLARQGLSAGAALAWARALGEFGATIIFAGSLAGRTQTLSLAIYQEFSAGHLDAALSMAALLVILSAGLLAGIGALLRDGGANEPTRAMERSWIRPWKSTSAAS